MCDLERRWEEEERRRLEGGGGCGEVWREGGWEEVTETVRSALHQTPLSEEEYLALRGQRGGGTSSESGKQSLTDYVRVSQLNVCSRTVENTNTVCVYVVCRQFSNGAH